MVELESEDFEDKVPAGLKISPANFLSAPTDERFRSVIEGDNHQHQIIKINHKDGEVKTFGNFTRVTDTFSFETEDIREFCHITSGIFGTGFFSKPQCNHGAEMRFAVEHNQEQCPRENGSLEFFIVCQSRVEDCGTEPRKELKVLIKDSHILDTAAKHKMVILPGCKEGTDFNFLELCQKNGKLFLGDFPSNFEEKDCKKKTQFQCKLYNTEISKPSLKFSKFGTIDACNHPCNCPGVKEVSLFSGSNVCNKNEGGVNMGGQDFHNYGVMINVEGADMNHLTQAMHDTTVGTSQSPLPPSAGAPLSFQSPLHFDPTIPPPPYLSLPSSNVEVSEAPQPSVLPSQSLPFPW